MYCTCFQCVMNCGYPLGLWHSELPHLARAIQQVIQIVVVDLQEKHGKLCCLPNLATPNQLSPKWCWIKWTKKIGRDGLKCQPVSLDVSMSQIIQNHSVPQNGMVFSPLLKDHSICASQAAIFARRTSRKLNSTVGAAGPSDLALNFRLCHGNNGNTSNYINQTHVYMYIYYYIYIIILYIYVYIYICI